MKLENIGDGSMPFIDDPLISNVVFYPRKVKIPTDLGANVKILNLKINNETNIGGICFMQDKSLPTILMFHGNGEIALDYLHFFKLFFECGVNLTVIDYRGYGWSNGTPFYTCLITDAFPIYEKFKEWMKNEGFHNSLFVMGRSLGSVCASEIGSWNPPDLKGIFFESGFARLFNMMTRLFQVKGPQITKEGLKEWSNDTKITKIKKPVLILHGTNDWIVPISEGELIHETLPEDIEVKMVAIKGAGHNDIMMFKEKYVQALKSFIQEFK